MELHPSANRAFEAIEISLLVPFFTRGMAPGGGQDRKTDDHQDPDNEQGDKPHPDTG
jgi:hypothetical protein